MDWGNPFIRVASNSEKKVGNVLADLFVVSPQATELTFLSYLVDKVNNPIHENVKETQIKKLWDRDSSKIVRLVYVTSW